MHKPDRLQLSLKYRLHCKDILVPVVEKFVRKGRDDQVWVQCALGGVVEGSNGHYLAAPPHSIHLCALWSGNDRDKYIFAVLGTYLSAIRTFDGSRKQIMLRCINPTACNYPAQRTLCRGPCRGPLLYLMSNHVDTWPENVYFVIPCIRSASEQ
jgi:hypothetical protein